MYRTEHGIFVRVTGRRPDGRVSYEGVDKRVRGGIVPGNYKLYSESESV